MADERLGGLTKGSAASQRLWPIPEQETISVPKLKVKGAVEGQDGILRFPRTARERQAVRELHWVVLRHATPRCNLGSISERGLLTSFAQGRLPAVWLHSPRQSAAAMIHAARRHRVPVEEIIVIELAIARRSIRRFRGGLWYSLEDVRPSALRVAYDLDFVATSFGADPKGA